jgi:hypothetical protein
VTNYGGITGGITVTVYSRNYGDNYGDSLLNALHSPTAASRRAASDCWIQIGFGLPPSAAWSPPTPCPPLARRRRSAADGMQPVASLAEAWVTRGSGTMVP